MVGLWIWVDKRVYTCPRDGSHFKVIIVRLDHCCLGRRGPLGASLSEQTQVQPPLAPPHRRGSESRLPILRILEYSPRIRA